MQFIIKTDYCNEKLAVIHYTLLFINRVYTGTKYVIVILESGVKRLGIDLIIPTPLFSIHTRVLTRWGGASHASAHIHDYMSLFHILSLYI